MTPTEIRNLAYRYSNEYDKHLLESGRSMGAIDYITLVELFAEALHELNREKDSK